MPRAAAPAGDIVRLFSADDPEYQSLDIPDARRVASEAVRRLVVFRGGAPVSDRGLGNEKRVVERASSANAASEYEDGFVEDAEVSLDGRFALVLSTRYRKPVDPGTGVETKGKTDLTWIDPAHPEGLWSVSLERERWVKKVLLLSPKHGVAISTLTDPNGPADLRLYGPEGREMLRLKGEEASVVDMTTTSQGAFLAVDLAYPDRPALPNRGVLVLDLLHGTRWTYTWSYGKDGEPLSWSLADTGILEVKTPGGTRCFDRNGKPLKAPRGQ